MQYQLLSAMAVAQGRVEYSIRKHLLRLVFLRKLCMRLSWKSALVPSVKNSNYAIHGHFPLVPFLSGPLFCRFALAFAIAVFGILKSTLNIGGPYSVFLHGKVRHHTNDLMLPNIQIGFSVTTRTESFDGRKKFQPLFYKKSRLK